MNPQDKQQLEALAREQQVIDLGIAQILPILNGGGVSFAVAYDALLLAYMELVLQASIGAHQFTLAERQGCAQMGFAKLVEQAQRVRALRDDINDRGMDAVKEWQASLRPTSPFTN